MTPRDDLDELALSLADGADIDWEHVLDRGGGPPELAALRLIETIAGGHLPDAEATGPG